MLVELHGMVPITVMVDTENRSVERVVIIDEEVSDLQGNDSTLAQEAVEIAEEAVWPAWVFDP